LIFASTGQRLDGTGLYYYNARYYAPEIGRFISPDPITHSEPLPKGKIINGLTVYRTSVQFYTGQTRNPATINPQEHNRYSYAINNPLRYTDPDGHQGKAVTAAGTGFLIIPGIGWLVGGALIAVGVVWTVEANTGAISSTLNQ